ncbi:MAG: hypothetical protein BGO49_25305 [Planctomycetales bacterium 71-10]|nr:MAG: hypothetical protein BGO49_25305 [Planctomycetales bacterium 71-10]
MRTVEAFREAEGAEPWRRYLINLSSGYELGVDRPGLVTWDEPDPEYVRVAQGDGVTVLVALDAVVSLELKPAGR